MTTIVDAIRQILDIPNGTLGKSKYFPNSHLHDALGKHSGDHGIPVDILDTPNEFVFYMDVPGLSKSDIQVSIEDENTLVIKSNGKRKRDEGEDEGCKYMVLERRMPQKLMRKFRLPDNSKVSAITAKCENGVLTVVVEKLPPPSKPKTRTVEVSIS